MKLVVASHKRKAEDIIEELGLEGMEPVEFGEPLFVQAVEQALIVPPLSGMGELELSYVLNLARRGADILGV